MIFLDLNGIQVTLSDDEAHELIMRTAAGEADLQSIAYRLT
jgi:prophage maintenance system killer protein